MRVLVTGASGFVGAHLVEQLLQSGHDELWGMGKYPLKQPPAGLRGYHGGDLATERVSRAFLRDAAPEVVVHLAGFASVGRSWDNAPEVFDASVVSTVALYQALRDERLLPAHWINVGSSEEYAPSVLPLVEDSPVSARNPYGNSKIAQARLLFYLSARDNVRLTHFRPFNHIGPRQSRGFVISDWAMQIAGFRRNGGGQKVIVGNVEAVRDFLDVRDVARAYVLAVDGKVPPGIYNVASGIPRSLRAVLEEMLKLADVPAEIEQDYNLLRQDDVPTRVGNASKLTSISGWMPEIEWETTLQDVLDEAKTRTPG